MKIAVIIVRVLMGLLFLFASVTWLFKLFPEPELQGPMKTFNEGIAASVYIMPVIKVLELLCGLAFVSGRFVRLAAIVIFPIIVNILLTHVFLAPEGLPAAIFLLLGDIFLIYYYRKDYQSMLIAK